MRTSNIIKSLATALLCLGVISCAENNQIQQKAVLKTDKDSVSYAIGMDIGKTLKQQSIEVDPLVLAQAIYDANSPDSTRQVLNDTQLRAVIMSLSERAMKKQAEAQGAKATTHRKQAEEFLAQNKAKAGVTTTASGLQYEVIKEGSGAAPKLTDEVTVHYKGTTPDGQVFDSSYDRGEPAQFGVGGVIKGWTEALQLMKPGAKYKLYIPPDLAYGDNPPPGAKIEPGQMLTFEVELISIGKTAPPGGGDSAR